MTELEQRLHALGADLAFPATPAFVLPAVEPVPRPRRLVWAGIALAVVVVCFGAVLAASPGARSSLRDLFGIGSVRVIRVDDASTTGATLVPFGRPVSLAEAERAVAFELRVPPILGGAQPPRVYLDRTVGGGLVSFVWCCSPRVVLTELFGTEFAHLRKVVGRSTTIEEVSVNGNPALWIEGSDHVLRVVDSTGTFRERPVLVQGGVLVWVDGTVTLRLEGELTRDHALELARHLP